MQKRSAGPHSTARARRALFLSRAGVSRILLAVVVALSALYAFSEHRKALISATKMEKASLRFSIYLIAEGLRVYHDSTGTFPATLEEAGLDEERLEYITDGQTYRLIAVEDGSSIVYMEGNSTDRYRAAFNVLEGGAEQ
jgi:hypothetical protein